jgi:hypothetical protein
LQIEKDTAGLTSPISYKEKTRRTKKDRQKKLAKNNLEKVKKREWRVADHQEDLASNSGGDYQRTGLYNLNGQLGLLVSGNPYRGATPARLLTGLHLLKADPFKIDGTCLSFHSMHYDKLNL